MDYQESFIAYLQYEKRDSSHTVTAYRKDLSQFAQFCAERSGAFDPGSVDRKLVRDWVVSLMEAGLTPRSVRRKISTLKSYYRFLMKMGHLESTPVTDIPLPKVRKKLPVFVEEPRLNHLLDDGFFGSDFPGIRDKLVITLLYGTGIRLSELLSLPVARVDLDQCQIKVEGKRNKERIIPFPRSMKGQIREYLECREALTGSGEGMLVVTDKGVPAYGKLIYRIVRNYLTRVTLAEKRSPHVLRHTYATHLLNKGADLNAVKELLGHANLAATEVYTHTTFEKLHGVYRQAHPRG
ncbi:MAG: tyrosine-type recombinase/integrase [Prolixibacteraceae bacterium]|nr:tyrosine-type recombinase/integrase [Prolixibacteraceae bacterium]NLX27461.1 tyrosine-type recombinase/integrase [Bacteroidales bacterium]HOY51815.1 tyrosine-type recombinase/integrase [Prolixibacteraceae bacterium]